MASHRRYTEQDVRNAVACSPSLTAALRRLGLRTAGGNHATLRKLIAEYGISTDHFDPNWVRRGTRREHAIPLDEVLVPNSHYTRARLKHRLYEAGLKRRECELCGQGEEWNGARMSLILDHINGVATDNRLENLRIVCPNCAATLDTHCGRKNRLERDPRSCLYCGKEFIPKRASHRYGSQICGTHSKGPRKPRPERRKVERPSYEQLMADLQTMSVLAVGRRYGVSDNAVRKWIRWYEYQEARCEYEEARRPLPIVQARISARPETHVLSWRAGSNCVGAAPGQIPYDLVVTTPVVVILAAGEGTRMRSATPKLLHPLCGRPMIAWPVAAAREAGAGKVIVVDGPERRLEGSLDREVEFAIQERPLGTADAVKAAAAHIAPNSTVVVLNGDHPLITPRALAGLGEAHSRSGAAATVATAVLEDPTGYGRVVRAPDGTVERVVETKVEGDATELELRIREINTGIYAFDGRELLVALEQVRSDNAQGEFYLPDVLPILRKHERTVGAYEITDASELGVNDRAGLAEVRAVAQARIHRRLMAAGVTIVDPAATVIDADVEIGQDSVVAPFSSLHGATRIGERARIGPLTTLLDVRVGDEATIVHSYAAGADVGDRVSVGPFAYLRPGAVLREGSKAGTFVEIKNSEIGPRAKVPHLSYIGDADIGEGTNIGAGTITANYDGARKNRTRIGAGAFVSVDTMFVAPVTLGDGAYTGAGSVITEDVPPGALGVARAQQRNIEGYAERRKERDAVRHETAVSSDNDDSSARQTDRS